jgi:crossover junction endodeoxyribonuclease RuvC
LKLETKSNTDRIILGIDPGTNILGYGIIHQKGNTITLVAMDVLHLEKIGDSALKLKKIFETVLELIEKHKPDELSIEAPFFGKNVQSMLKLGRAQGVAIAAALSKSMPVFEYEPRKIKQSITGKGGASKEQVAAMLQRLLNFKEIPKYLDATDGLAAAVCHYFQRKPSSGDQKSYKSWKNFLSENPDRVK